VRLSPAELATRATWICSATGSPLAVPRALILRFHPTQAGSPASPSKTLRPTNTGVLDLLEFQLLSKLYSITQCR
jgi:hypothetical protein